MLARLGRQKCSQPFGVGLVADVLTAPGAGNGRVRAQKIASNREAL
jgi:hypothetical protein